VIIPLLKCLDILFEKQVLTDLGSHEETATFSNALLPRLKAEMKGCKDPKKIMAILMVLGHVLVLTDTTRSAVLSTLMILLGHRFPRVRKASAEQLYLRLLELDDLTDGNTYDGVLDVLSTTVWDGEDMKKAREERDTVAKSLGLEPPTVSSSQSDGTVGKENKHKSRSDDLESYAALVKEAGY